MSEFSDLASKCVEISFQVIGTLIDTGRIHSAGEIPDIEELKSKVNECISEITEMLKVTSALEATEKGMIAVGAYGLLYEYKELFEEFIAAIEFDISTIEHEPDLREVVYMYNNAQGEIRE